MSFQQRSEYHDKIAIPYVIKKLEEYGCSNVVTQGHEYDKDELRQLLFQRRNKIALLKRYKPDIIMEKDGELVYCEVKSDYLRHENYAIEFDSFATAQEHRKNGSVIYTFVDIEIVSKAIKKSGICDIDDIPFPARIYVPMRPDYKETLNYIQNNFPNVRPSLIEHNSGSGTAYFLISKTSKFLQEWNDFFSVNVEQLSLL
jgi:hypothetical protein